MAQPIRRVVTGLDQAGRSVFVSDGAPPATFSPGAAAVTVTELWETRATPADNTGRADRLRDRARRRDVLIQRGTNHAWSNRTDAPVRVAFVLIDAHPL